MSYYPGLEPLIIRVYPDQVFLGKLDFELKIFISKLKTTIEELK